MPVPPFPIPDPDDPDGGPLPDEWASVDARPMPDADACPVTCRRALSTDPHGLTEDYRGGAMRRRHGIDDDHEPLELERFVLAGGR